MKVLKYSVLILFISLCNCMVKLIPSKLVTYDLDFKKYSEKDFIITTDNINEKYKSIGYFDYSLRAEAIFLDTIIENGKKKYIYEWKIDKKIDDLLLEYIYETGLKKGANGLINMKMKIEDEEEEIGMGKKIYLPLINISGLFISREKKEKTANTAMEY